MRKLLMAGTLALMASPALAGGYGYGYPSDYDYPPPGWGPPPYSGCDQGPVAFRPSPCCGQQNVNNVNVEVAVNNRRVVGPPHGCHNGWCASPRYYQPYPDYPLK